MSAFFARIGEAGFYGIIGMGVIFLVLAMIWAVIELFGVIGRKYSEKYPEKPEEEEEEIVPAVPEDDTGEIAAAITAAVYLILAEEAEKENRKPSAFRVVAFKRGRV